MSENASQNPHKQSDTDAAAEQVLQTVAELADRDAQLEEMQQQLAQMQERLQTFEQQNQNTEELLRRTAADFQNYRRRTEQDRAKWRDEGRVEVISRLLDIYDDLTRSLDAIRQAGEGEASASLREGVELVFRKFADEMERFGVKPIEAVGEPFDVAQHDALMQEPAPEGVEPGTVLEEFQRGYRMGERVLRHSRVKVAS